MKIIKLDVFNIVMNVNNYIILNEETNKGILVDCSYDYETINKYCIENNISITHVILTHCHFDHVSGTKNFVKDKNIKVLISEVESKILNNYVYNLCDKFEEELEYIDIDKTLIDGDKIVINDIEIKIIETPGHTKGSICLLVDNNLISGDTIFKATHGRCDLPSGNQHEIISSIKSKILTLSPNIKIYPGHGEFTYIENEITNY